MPVFRQHYAGLVRFAMLLSPEKADAEDIVQDAFVRVYPKAEQLASEAMVAYLRTTIVNLCRMRIRRRSMMARRIPPADGTHVTSDDPAVVVWRNSKIRDALLKLPQRQREAIVLRYYLDLSTPQLAEHMSISTSAARAYLSRAEATLATLLAGVTT